MPENGKLGSPLIVLVGAGCGNCVRSMQVRRRLADACGRRIEEDDDEGDCEDGVNGDRWTGIHSVHVAPAA